MDHLHGCSGRAALCSTCYSTQNLVPVTALTPLLKYFPGWLQVQRFAPGRAENLAARTELEPWNPRRPAAVLRPNSASVVLIHWPRRAAVKIQEFCGIWRAARAIISYVCGPNRLIGRARSRHGLGRAGRLEHGLSAAHLALIFRTGGCGWLHWLAARGYSETLVGPPGRSGWGPLEAFRGRPCPERRWIVPRPAARPIGRHPAVSVRFILQPNWRGWDRTREPSGWLREQCSSRPTHWAPPCGNPLMSSTEMPTPTRLRRCQMTFSRIFCISAAVKARIVCPRTLPCRTVFSAAAFAATSSDNSAITIRSYCPSSREPP